MPVTYAVTIDPVTANADEVFEILNEHTESRKRASACLRSGGFVIEMSDENEAEAVAARLKEAGATVEIEQRSSQGDDPDAYVVSGVVRHGPVDGMPLEAIEGVGVDRAAELREIGYETVADTVDADREDLTEATDIGDALAERILDAATGGTVPGVTVRAFDRDLRSEQLLGEDTTDEEGRYEITYTPGRFQRAERGGPDLVLRVFDARGAELDAEADRGAAPEGDERATRVLFDADPVETVDLTVDSPERPEPSEYERVRAELGPLLAGVAPTDLTDEDIWFLVNESATERLRVEAFVDSAALAGETGLLAEPFYGLLREGHPAELEALLDVPSETLTASLEDAVEGNVVREDVLDSLDDLLDRFEELQAAVQPRVRYEVVVDVSREGSGAPLAEHTVRAVDTTTDPERPLGSGVTDADGRAEFDFTLPEGTDPVRAVRFRIRDPQGDEVHEATRKVSFDPERAASVEIVVPASPAPGAIALDDSTLLETLQRTCQDSERVETVLAALGDLDEPVTTLADVRAAGGLSRLLERVDDAPEPDDTLVTAVDAHVDLSLLSGDPTVNATLVEEGYRSPFAVAAAPRADFVETISAGDDGLDPLDAARLHYSASAQRHAMDNITTTIMTNHANNTASRLGDGD